MVLEPFVHPKGRIQIYHVVYFLDFGDIAGLGKIVGHIKDFILAIIKHISSKEKRKQEIEKGKIEIEKGKIEILHLKADYKIKMADYDIEMVQLAEKRGYGLSELRGPPHLYYDQPDASTHPQPGMIHKYQGNYGHAVDIYQQSLKIEQKLGGRSGIANTLHNLAAIHEKKDEDYPAALEKYYKALSIFKELHSPDAAIAENNIARLKETMGEEAFSEAMEDIMRKYGA